MIITKIDGLECDPIKLSRISCAGMGQLLTMPGSKTAQVQWLPVDQTQCVLARKTHQLATSLGKQVIAHLTTFKPKQPPVRVFLNYVWKTKTIYKFAQYGYIKEPGGPIFHACVYLGKENFVWEPYARICPNPRKMYDKFKDIPMNADGSPILRVPSSTPTYKPVTPLWPYDQAELQYIRTWEGIVSYYDREYSATVAKYEQGE